MPASRLGKRKRAEFDGDIERLAQEDVVLNLSSIFQPPKQAISKVF